jgi:hypothetical protein
MTAYHGTLSSHYVLYDDSAFALQFVSGRFGRFEYAGRYTRAGDRVALSFDGWSTAGAWEATAVLRGDSLSVKYNTVMMLSDFMDGSYVRQR